MRKLTTSPPGVGGIALLAITALLLGSLPAQVAHAATRPAALQANDQDETETGPSSADTTMGDNPDAGTNTTVDERFAAAAVLGWTPRDELSMSDKDFVIVLWEKADEYFNPEVKKAAKDAFADMNDPEASARFIQEGIFGARDRDAALKVVRAQRDTERLSAAQELGWVPADDDARRAMLRSTNNNFLFELSRKAESGSEVRKGAEAVVEASEQEQLAFITTGVHTAAATDRANKIEAGKQREIEEQQAKMLRDIKGAAISAALGRVATQFELEHSTERDLIYKIKTESTGVQVKAAGAVAYDSDKPADWRAYLATGVHVARTADIAERDRAEAAENERKVREILNDAKFDKYQPALATAANVALQGNASARSVFLLEGREKAAKLDVVRPATYMTVALQGSRSKRCIQVAGGVSRPNAGGNADNAPMELWDCDENGRQRWQLMPISPVSAGKFLLQSANSKKCLEVPGGTVNDDVRLVQYQCAAGTTKQQWEFIDTGKGTMELRNVASNKVATGSATANASAVGQSNNTHTLDQQWRVIDFSHHQLALPPLTGKVTFKGLRSGRCLQVAGATDKPDAGGNADNAPIELWDCNVATSRQVWEFVPVAGNRFALKNANKGKCLDIAGGNVAAGAPAIQYTCFPNGNHQWVLMSTGKQGSFMLRNSLTGTYIDVKSAGTANASLVHGWPYTGTNDQHWTPQPVS